MPTPRPPWWRHTRPEGEEEVLVDLHRLRIPAAALSDWCGRAAALVDRVGQLGVGRRDFHPAMTRSQRSTRPGLLRCGRVRGEVSTGKSTKKVGVRGDGLTRSAYNLLDERPDPCRRGRRSRAPGRDQEEDVHVGVEADVAARGPAHRVEHGHHRPLPADIDEAPVEADPDAVGPRQRQARHAVGPPSPPPLTRAR